MQLFKKSGCPNCKTESNFDVFDKDDFKKFKKLALISKYGKDTELFECTECHAKYINVEHGNLYHRLSPKFEEIFFKFFDKSNVISTQMKQVLDTIGSPSGVFEYPAQVKTKDGQVFKHAVIRILDSIWPIILDVGKLHFISEIDEVIVSDEAMTLQQRIAGYEAPEMRMGVAPIWLKKNDLIYMSSYSQFFIPSSYGKPKDFTIERSIDKPMPFFDSLPVTYFTGTQNPR